MRAVAISLSRSFRQSRLARALSSHRNLSRVGGEPEVTIKSEKKNENKCFKIISTLEIRIIKIFLLGCLQVVHLTLLLLF